MSGDLAAWVDRLGGHHVVVAGDVVLDEYLHGQAQRLSREAPIPVLEFERQVMIPGGGANPTVNVTRLGSRAVQIGVIGPDAQGETLRDLLRAYHIDPSGLVIDLNRQTTTKTRLMAHMGLRFPQQVARIDRIDRTPIGGEVETAVLMRLAHHARHAHTIMVSDYQSGLLTEKVIAAVRAYGQSGLLITADAQGALERYTGFDLVKCNAEEAARFLGRRLRDDDDFARAGTDLMGRVHLRRAVLITRGPDGISVIGPGGSAHHLRAARIEDVYDTVGAGDTVLAVVTLALLAGADPVQAAMLANAAAGIVVRKVGNYAPSPDDLRAALRG